MVALQPGNEFERLQWQRRNEAHELCFVGTRHDVLCVAHAFRQIRRRQEKDQVSLESKLQRPQ